MNAFLEQELGFRNTKKLQHGIVGYLRHRREQQQEDEPRHSDQSMDAMAHSSAWRGANFVFDRRTLVGDVLDETQSLEPNEPEV